MPGTIFHLSHVFPDVLTLALPQYLPKDLDAYPEAYPKVYPQVFVSIPSLLTILLIPSPRDDAQLQAYFAAFPSTILMLAAKSTVISLPRSTFVPILMPVLKSL